jgi:hypothetical protein
VIFLSNFDIINSELPVNSSAQAIMTSIRPNENVIHEINFLIQNGVSVSHEILVIENNAHRAMNIHANMLSRIIFQILLFVFCIHVSLNFSVISDGVRDAILYFMI